MNETASILLAGAGNPFGDEIAGRLRDQGKRLLETRSYAVQDALAGADMLDAVIVVAPTPVLGTAFFDVDDDQLETGMAQFLDLFEVLNLAIPRLRDGGCVILVEHRGHLGGWGGAHEMAFAGAAAGLMRSVTLENMNRKVRANVVAVELPGTGAGQAPSSPQEVTDLVDFLLSPNAAALNGELLLANGGRSLLLREGRDRRPRPTSHTPTDDRIST